MKTSKAPASSGAFCCGVLPAPRDSLPGLKLATPSQLAAVDLTAALAVCRKPRGLGRGIL
jgi:hypothetical protein